MAVLFKMCDEDRTRFPGGPEWVRFDEADLDDLDGVVLAEYEASMGVNFHLLYAYDKPRNTIRWQMCQVWMACRLAGMEVPDLVNFTIKIRKVERKDEHGDADPPALSSSSTSSAAAQSRKRKR